MEALVRGAEGDLPRKGDVQPCEHVATEMEAFVGEQGNPFAEW